MKTLTLALALTACCASIASATVLVDQSIEAQEFSGTAHIYSLRDWSQSFRVGKTGEMTGIDLLLMRDEIVQLPLLVDVRMMSVGGLPLAEVPTVADDGATVLAKSSVLPENVPSMPRVVGYDLNAAAMVHVALPRFSVIEGQSLAIVLRSSAPLGTGLGYMWLTGYPTYPQGEMFSRPPDGTEWTSGFNVAGFRTYVDVVPEPTTFTLAATSVVLIAAVRNSSGNSFSRSLRRPQGWPKLDEFLKNESDHTARYTDFVLKLIDRSFTTNTPAGAEESI